MIKLLRKLFVRDSTADGIVNLSELAAINELETKYGNSGINMAVFGPMAAFAPGALRTLGSVVIKPTAKTVSKEVQNYDTKLSQQNHFLICLE